MTEISKDRPKVPYLGSLLNKSLPKCYIAFKLSENYFIFSTKIGIFCPSRIQSKYLVGISFDVEISWPMQSKPRFKFHGVFNLSSSKKGWKSKFSVFLKIPKTRANLLFEFETSHFEPFPRVPTFCHSSNFLPKFDRHSLSSLLYFLHLRWLLYLWCPIQKKSGLQCPVQNSLIWLKNWRIGQK